MEENKTHTKSIAAIVLVLFAGILSPLVENGPSCDCGNPPCWPELSGEMGWNNWYVTKVTVTFNGTIDELLYRINGSNWINYHEPFTIKTEGIHLLEWACDSNMSNISCLEIKIDIHPPILSNEPVKRIGLFKWQFSVNATDEVSGVNKVLCLWTPEIYDTEPPYQFIYIGFYRLFNL